MKPNTSRFAPLLMISSMAQARCRHKSLFVFLFFLFPVLIVAQNQIVLENQKTGNPASEWDINGAGDLSIQGFATDISVNKGQTVLFKIKTDASAYTISIYRLGYYQGNGARRVGTGVITATLPQQQPANLVDRNTGLIDCGNWAVSARWDVPPDAVSGVYLARLRRNDNGGASHIVFIVRDDASSSDLFFQTSDATWQAYNAYGGNSLYVGNTSLPNGHAAKVSYNRPFLTRNGGGGGGAAEDWLFNAEYPMIRWLERNGYDLTYTTNVDADRRGNLIRNHKVFLSVGHDEYWSGPQRANVEAARQAGVHLAFFSGNEVYWKTRWEASIDGSGTAYRTLVCYKEGTEGENVCGSKCDPLQNVWTGLWRSGCGFQQADGCKPENALTGQISWAEATASIQVPAAYRNYRFWRNTTVATLNTGQVATLSFGTLGYELDYEQNNGSYPSGRVKLSQTNVSGSTHQLSLYRHSSGALVFGAGTVQWSWGLDGTHDRGTSTQDARMQQATVNLFADMGAQPGSLQNGLVAATAIADQNAPATAISSPGNGSVVTPGASVTISGTATESGGGVVVGVEVSVDGGATWVPANGTTSWNYTWVPPGTGTYTIKSRGWDDMGNLESIATTSNTITVSTNSTTCTTLPTGELSAGASDCSGQNISLQLSSATGQPPFSAVVNNVTYNNVTVGVPFATVPANGQSLWGNSGTPQILNDNDGQAIEVGVKFRSSVSGTVTGVRFYKGSQNTGTHVGSLWSASGTKLATATFSAESASGWQEVRFATPVSISANTTYVVSYHSPGGGYSSTTNYFTSNFTSGPLSALASGVEGGNGVYKYGTSGFPTNSFNASNYWVDVLFSPSTYIFILTQLTDGRGCTNTGSLSTATVSQSQLQQGSNTYYRDADGDGYGNPAVTTQDCTQPSGYVTNKTDCNDNDAAINPGATEVCGDGKDNNCNGSLDEGCPVATTYYRDADGDGYGDPNMSTTANVQPSGYVSNNTDCNDNDAAIHAPLTYYRDADGDGYGNAAVPTSACATTQPAGYVFNNTDCNDNNAAINPATIWYLDSDNDGYSTGSGVVSCTSPGSGYRFTGLLGGGDCNDNNAAINPGATEVCGNNVDENCNGSINEGCPVSAPPSLSINSITVYEAQGSATLSVTLSRPATTTVSVSYATQDGTAVSTGRNKDYSNTKGTLSISAGATSATLRVTLVSDRISEGTESFTVQLSKAVNATLGTATGTVTLLDGAPPSTLTQSGVRPPEAASPADAPGLQLRVRPNPSAHTFSLELRSSRSAAPVRLRVVDATGRVVESREQLPANTTLTLGERYPPGLYLVLAWQEDQFASLQLIKMKK